MQLCKVLFSYLHTLISDINCQKLLLQYEI
uniref:Uncharacterized protein n=1 Tax=Myoviridae sp. ctWXg38 TaxID=2825119 RepID=A0A8S5PLI4_9CAUD|nr:MAG TPA: hypothetical protein [Myoviridae sp. ctWXg38]